MSNQAAKLVSVTKLYRDALKIAELVAFHQEQSKTKLQRMVRSAFRGNAHLVKEDDILSAKQDAIMAMGNYHALKAVDLASKVRDQHIISQAAAKRSKSARKAA